MKSGRECAASVIGWPSYLRQQNQLPHKKGQMTKALLPYFSAFAPIESEMWCLSGKSIFDFLQPISQQLLTSRHIALFSTPSLLPCSDTSTGGKRSDHQLNCAKVCADADIRDENRPQEGFFSGRTHIFCSRFGWATVEIAGFLITFWSWLI